jgi:hypothetical protein
VSEYVTSIVIFEIMKHHLNKELGIDAFNLKSASMGGV